MLIALLIQRNPAHSQKEHDSAERIRLLDAAAAHINEQFPKIDGNASRAGGNKSTSRTPASVLGLLVSLFKKLENIKQF